MSTKAHNYHVIARSNGNWSVHRLGAARVTKNYATKREAIAAGKRLTRASGGGDLVVQANDGRVISRIAVDSLAPTLNHNDNPK